MNLLVSLGCFQLTLELNTSLYIRINEILRYWNTTMWNTILRYCNEILDNAQSIELLLIEFTYMNVVSHYMNFDCTNCLFSNKYW